MAHLQAQAEGVVPGRGRVAPPTTGAGGWIRSRRASYTCPFRPPAPLGPCARPLGRSRGRGRRRRLCWPHERGRTGRRSAGPAGDRQGRKARQGRLGELLERHRARLLRMVDLRMDPAPGARIGASDVLQESWLEVSDRLDKHLENPRLPLFVWIRSDGCRAPLGVRSRAVSTSGRSFESALARIRAISYAEQHWLACGRQG